MIVINLIGGLGNQMFQYAAARALSLDKNTKLELNVAAFQEYTLHAYGLNHFALPQNTYKKPSRVQRKIMQLFKNKKVYVEKEFTYNPSFFKLKGNPIFLEGYFQCEQYFIKYESEIRADFEITTPLKSKTLETITKMQSVNSVALHFRRGDYLLHEMHNTEKENYYKDAMKMIEDKIDTPVYFLFSDDMDWVKENITSNFETHYIDFNDAATNYEDLKLMASCKHNIIANSSFSWWGAWLNKHPNKIVIAPKIWFNDTTFDYKDVVPKSWIRL